MISAQVGCLPISKKRVHVHIQGLMKSRLKNQWLGPFIDNSKAGHTGPNPWFPWLYECSPYYRCWCQVVENFRVANFSD